MRLFGFKLRMTAPREITARSDVDCDGQSPDCRPKWERSPLIIVRRDQVTNDWRGAGNKQSGYTLLVAPVSLCDTFMLAQMF